MLPVQGVRAHKAVLKQDLAVGDLVTTQTTERGATPSGGIIRGRILLHAALSAPYTIRVKVPRGVKLMPHKHPEDRVYTVISGVFYIGLGDQFDVDKLQAYGAGSVVVLPGDTYHFHWAKSSEYITQVTAIGPLGLEYFDAKEDPRNNKS